MKQAINPNQERKTYQQSEESGPSNKRVSALVWKSTAGCLQLAFFDDSSEAI